MLWRKLHPQHPSVPQFFRDDHAFKSEPIHVSADGRWVVVYCSLCLHGTYELYRKGLSAWFQESYDKAGLVGRLRHASNLAKEGH